MSNFGVWAKSTIRLTSCGRVLIRRASSDCVTSCAIISLGSSTFGNALTGRVIISSPTFGSDGVGTVCLFSKYINSASAAMTRASSSVRLW